MTSINPHTTHGTPRTADQIYQAIVDLRERSRRQIIAEARNGGDYDAAALADMGRQCAGLWHDLYQATASDPATPAWAFEAAGAAEHAAQVDAAEWQRIADLKARAAEQKDEEVAEL